MLEIFQSNPNLGPKINQLGRVHVGYDSPMSRTSPNSGHVRAIIRTPSPCGGIICGGSCAYVTPIAVASRVFTILNLFRGNRATLVDSNTDITHHWSKIKSLLALLTVREQWEPCIPGLDDLQFTGRYC